MKSTIKSILGGSFISIGCFAYMITLAKTNNVFLASATFYIGLGLILLFNCNLFTGKVMTLYNTKPTINYIWDLINIWIYNLFGSMATSILLSQIINIDAVAIIQIKFTLSPIQLIISGLACNIFVCGAVHSYTKTKNHIMSWFLITIFVLIGLEHGVANMTYMSLAFINNYNFLEIVNNLFFVTIGNVMGGLLIANLRREEE
ncbi:formate/nitrite transporter family protein [Clostridium sp. 1001283B150210_160208_E6]|uniref:formate/nitrite transporter family protein n=1 Tax=Clostridium sp. 1001283B150210_160208_E6 TaxID=2787129 RepID=UPI0018A8CEAE|nr:formate/nitrite transporter family protein [Clostridium sp. 1001283B150210_160208_E6]